MIDTLIANFTAYCIKYPDMPIQSVFNRYMQLLNDEQITVLTPCFDLMVKTGEAARSALPEVQDLIIQEITQKQEV